MLEYDKDETDDGWFHRYKTANLNHEAFGPDGDATIENREQFAAQLKEMYEANNNETTYAEFLKKENDGHHGYAADSCSAKGSRYGRTQAFITAVYCEMMRAYTVRCAPGDGTNPPWMWEVFFRNKWIHIACSISFWLTIAITLIPWISDLVFSLYAPPFLSYLIAIAFPIANAALDEFVPKPLYKVLVVYPAMKAREAEAVQ